MRTLRTIVALLLVGVSALNVVAVALSRGYDQRIGFLHLVAHDGFKALQYFAASLLFALLLKCAAAPNPAESAAPERGSGGTVWGTWLVAACVAAAYLPSAFVNFSHPDWTQAHIGAGISGLSSIASWFTHPQPDGFYRPLGFISIWLDYLLFGMTSAGYHVQNIGLHAINAALVGKLSSKLGYSRKAATITALLFAIAPVCVEPVTWPAARYDLLATFFVLGALICAADCVGREHCGWVRLLAVALLVGAAILSKEVGYAAPLLVAVLVSSRNLWSVPRSPTAVRLLVAASAPAALGVVIRLMIYHGLGGYHYAQGSSPVFTLSARAVWAVTTRLLLVPFAVNTAGGISAFGAAALVLFAMAGFLGALRCSSSLRREHAAIALCAVLSALPASAILGWVGPSMAASRYLYLPSVWIAMLFRADSVRSQDARSARPVRAGGGRGKRIEPTVLPGCPYPCRSRSKSRPGRRSDAGAGPFRLSGGRAVDIEWTALLRRSGS